MSLPSTSSVVAADALLMRDVDGRYRPARAEEVPSQAPACHSAAVVLAHNHPSGSVAPSSADEFLTQTQSALALVEVQVLDHLMVAGADVCAFSERGLP